MTGSLPYCGTPPLPGELLTRFNLDPFLIAALLLAFGLQLWLAREQRGQTRARSGLILIGWAIAAAAFLSPLCALSVALFSARVAQHMVLVLVAAPLIAMGLPRGRAAHYSVRLWTSVGLFFAALWFWHMPTPYDATFTSTGTYWSMHLTLFGSAILLWRELLDHPAQQTAQALTAGMITFVHMGLLGAVLTLAERPWFLWHLATTDAWGLTPVEDQQLGGTLMWVPGIALFLWAPLRSLNRLWNRLERPGPA